MDDFTKMFDIPCQLSCDDNLPKLGNALLTAIFRIVQESLTNIAKHSKASFVHIHVQLDKGILAISVQDNGIGFNFDFSQDAARKDTQSFGLQSMLERMLAFNGQVLIDSAPGSGCCVMLSVPTGGGGDKS